MRQLETERVHLFVINLMMKRLRDTHPGKGLLNTSVDQPFSGGFVPIYTGGEYHSPCSEGPKQKEQLNSRRSQAWRATMHGTSWVLKHFVARTNTERRRNTSSLMVQEPIRMHGWIWNFTLTWQQLKWFMDHFTWLILIYTVYFNVYHGTSRQMHVTVTR